MVIKIGYVGNSNIALFVIHLFYRLGIDYKIATAFEQNIIGQNSASDKGN